MPSYRERGGADTEVIVVKGTARDMKGSQTGGADSDKREERGGRKMSWREHNIAPYPQHMTGILGPIENTI